MIIEIMKYLFLLLPCIQASSHKRSFLKMTTSDIFDMSKHPSEIIKSFYGQPIGGEWTYSELLKNLDENHVGAVSISSNNTIDSNISCVAELARASLVSSVSLFPFLIEREIILNLFKESEIFFILNCIKISMISAH